MRMKHILNPNTGGKIPAGNEEGLVILNQRDREFRPVLPPSVYAIASKGYAPLCEATKSTEAIECETMSGKQ